MESNSSINTLEKMLIDYNNKNEFITNGIIKLEHNKIYIEFVNKKKKKIQTKESKFHPNNKKEELLDESDMFSETNESNTILDNSELSSSLKSVLKTIQKSKEITPKSNNMVNKSICFLIDSFFKEKDNNKIWIFNKENNKEKNSTKRYSNFNNKKQTKIKKNSCMNKFHFYDVNTLFNKIEKDVILNTICSICLAKFNTDEEISMINNCMHIFHNFCLNEWIDPLKKNKNSCPFCKLVLNKEL